MSRGGRHGWVNPVRKICGAASSPCSMLEPRQAERASRCWWRVLQERAGARSGPRRSGVRPCRWAVIAGRLTWRNTARSSSKPGVGSARGSTTTTPSGLIGARRQNTGGGLQGPSHSDQTGGIIETTVRSVQTENRSKKKDHLIPNVHENAAANVAIETRGAEIRFLPVYSPDFNPIEMLFAKIKVLVRSAAARCFDTLCGAIGRALDAVSDNECSNYLRHAGYDPT